MNWRSCKDSNVARVFKVTIGGKFAAFNLVDCNVDMLTGNIEEVIPSVAQEVLGHKKRRSNPGLGITS